METFPHIIQGVFVEELAQCAAPHNQETGERQEFLKAFWFPQPELENPELTEPMPWEDPLTFLASFEQVAKACQWPREVWVARLQPALTGDAKKSFSELGTRDREDYEKVKAAILQGDALKMETQRQRFRHFRYQQAEDPRRIYSQLQELCHQWLKPERHTKEQILELLILEQFQAILPPETQDRMKDGGTNACFRGMILVEDLLSSNQEVKTWKLQEPVQETVETFSATVDVPSDSAEGQIDKEVKQHDVGDHTLQSSEIMTQEYSGSKHDVTGWEVIEVELTKEDMDVKSVAVPLNEAEQTTLDHSRGPMYWEVLEEDYKNVDSSGVLIPKSEEFPALGQEEFVFIQVSEDTETFPSNLTGNWRKDENGTSQQQSPELREQPDILPGECKDEVSLSPRAGDTFHEQSQQDDEQGDEEMNKSREVLPQQGGNELKEVHHISKKGTKSKKDVSQEEKYEPESPQEGKTVQAQTEYIRLSEGHISLMKTTQHTWVKRLLYSKGRRTCPSGPLGLVTPKVLSKKSTLYPCPICGKTFFQKGILEDHQCVHTGKKLYECPSCGKKFRWRRWVVEHQRVHTGEKPYICSKCGKSFRWRAGLSSHREVHTKSSRVGKATVSWRESQMKYQKSTQD